MPHPATYLLRVDQAAEHVDLTVKTLYTKRSDGTGPKSIKINGRLWFDPVDLDRWMNAQALRTVRGMP